MSELMRTRVKTTTKRSRTILAKFQGRKHNYIHYANISWMVEQGFEFPQSLEVQGANTFLDMSGKTYPTLIREFLLQFSI
ncbi:hypothetical protein Lal_00000990 [Lupinus albus]|nr:hypothetical protein Lal_00000990 [Lupinus albus]